MSILKSVYESAKGLYERGLIDDETFREFQEACGELPREVYEGLEQAKQGLGKTLQPSEFDQQLDDISS